MKTVWLKGCTVEQKTEMKKEFIASSHLRSKLTELLNDKLSTINTSLRSKSNYENPAWAYQQADGIGYERAIYEVIALIANSPVEK
jgi:hypothetical protein